MGTPIGDDVAQGQTGAHEKQQPETNDHRSMFTPDPKQGENAVVPSLVTPPITIMQAFSNFLLAQQVFIHGQDIRQLATAQEAFIQQLLEYLSYSGVFQAGNY